MGIFLAALPLLVAIVMLAVLQRSGLQTSLATLGIAIGVALVVPTLRLSLYQLLLALGSGFATSLTVLSVLFPALLLYQLQQAQGSMSVLARGITRFCPERDLLVLFIVLGIAPFVESVSGFGVGTVVAIPILVALGFEPLQAAVVGLFGQIAVPWGALAVGIAVGAQLTKLDPGMLGATTALITAPLPILFGIAALVMSGGIRAIRRHWLVACLAGILLVGGEWFFSQVPGIELAGALASLLSGALLGIWGYLLARRTNRFGKGNVGEENLVGLAARPNAAARVYPQSSLDASVSPNVAPHFWLIVVPYIILTITLLLSRLIIPVRDWLQMHVVVGVPSLGLSLPLLYIPGFWVLLAALSVIPLLRISRAEVQQIIARTWRQFFPGAVAILCFLAASQVMNASGMITVLGVAAATLGSNYDWVAPWLGALGGWLTGSNAGGNAMFALLQKSVSVRAGLSLNWVMGAQNGAASIATMVSPARVILATTTAGLLGKESSIVRKIGPIVLVAIVVIMMLLVGITAR